MARTVWCAILAAVAIQPVSATEPPAVLTNKQVRFLSLPEAIAIALEHGASGPARVPARQSPQGDGLSLLLPAGQSRTEFERNVSQMLLNVETAYWNLYGACWQVYSREQGLRFAYEAWEISGERYRAGQIGRADYAQARGQYELFRTQRLAALDTALDNERQLRALPRMPVEDGTRLVPCDAPSLTEYRPNWQEALKQALANRPELLLTRQEVNIHRLKLLGMKVLAVLDGRHIAYKPEKEEFLWREPPWSPEERVAHRGFIEEPPGWLFHLLPLPAAWADLNRALLQWYRSYLTLQDQELKTERFLGREYRRISSLQDWIKAARAQRGAFATQLKARHKDYRAGRGSLDQLLEAQRLWADAVAAEYQAIVGYNNARCGFDYARAAILQRHKVAIVDTPPSGGVPLRVAESERERTRLRVLRERGLPADPLRNTPATEGTGIPPAAPTLPALWKAIPPLEQAGALAPETGVRQREGARASRPIDQKVEDLFPGGVLPASHSP